MMAVRMLCFLLLGVSSVKGHQVGAIYFGDWHVDAHMEAYHTPNWTEYNLVINAEPRFDGHIQPNIPKWLSSAPENTPDGAQLRIDAATDAGIDFFLFDWYWYNEMNASHGGPFLDGALEDGFLKAPNNTMEFALMWANQDWVDLHPAKAGWHGSYRTAPDDHRIRQLLMYDGFMNSSTYNAALAYVVDKYMTRPNYLKVETLQHDGSIKNCSLFSFYQAAYIVTGTGSFETANQVLANFRAYAAAANVGCLHISLMAPTGLQGPVNKLKVDSVSQYGWMKTVGGTAFPYAQYADVQKKAVALWQNFTTEYGVPYIPSLSVAWDPSPRCLRQEAFVDIGYPWGSTWRSTPAEFQSSLSMAQTYLEQRCDPKSKTDICPPLFINAWNEWSEGAYLEPDEREGDARLQAIKAVFGS